jgi:hypothetical protein
MVSRISELEDMRREMDKLRVSIMNEEVLIIADRHIARLQSQLEDAQSTQAEEQDVNDIYQRSINQHRVEQATKELTAMKNLVKRHKKALTTTDTVEGYKVLARTLRDASENSRSAASNYAICRLIGIVENLLQA